MTKKFNQYLGKAGHLYVMSEFLMLGWNVAIPEVDIGDDIFVVQDDNGTLRRVQVKTSTSTVRKDGFSGQFSISVKNLRNITFYFSFTNGKIECSKQNLSTYVKDFTNFPKINH